MKQNRDKILNFFLEYPTRGFSLRELERLTKIGFPSVRNYVRGFQQENLVNTRKIQRFTLLYANHENEMFKRLKVFHTLQKIHESGLIRYINETLSYPVIILFGSSARGEDTNESDIDLFIESPETVDLTKYEKKFKKEIQVIYQKRFSLIKNKHLANNILNGMVLSGFLEVYH